MKNTNLLTFLAVGVAVYLLTRPRKNPPLSPANPTNNTTAQQQQQTAALGRRRAINYADMCV